MKFHLQDPGTHNLFTGYGAGYLLVNRVRYERSLVVTPERVIDDWKVEDFDTLSARHFEFLLDLKPEIVLLGTGAALRFPPPALSRCLPQARIGLEIMDTSAACRTYNILMAEGRSVLAAVIPA
jgi:uncharacterized protein